MPDLPPVEQKFTADTSAFVAGIQLMIDRVGALIDQVHAATRAVAELAGALAALGGSFDITSNISTMVSQLEALQAKISSLHGKNVEIGITQLSKDISDHVNVTQDSVSAVADHSSGLNALTGEARDLAVAMGLLTDKEVENAQAATRDAAAWGSLRANLLAGLAGAEPMAGALMLIRENLTEAASGGRDFGDMLTTIGVSVPLLTRIAGAFKDAADAELYLNAKTAAADFSFAKLATTGGRVGTIIHWALAGGAEAAAILLPALYALAAGLLVATQGAQHLWQHMSSLQTAVEATYNMTGKSLGTFLGLGNALQQAQNKANPLVYSALGSAVQIASVHMGQFAQTGLQVDQVFSEFAARVAVDMTGALGGTVQGLLRDAINMLVGLGQVLGNVGHALLNFAAAMPGLAKILLALANAASQFLLWISNLPAPLITVAMAMEEIWRWGGALAAIIVKLGLGFAMFVSSGFGVGAVLSRIGEVVKGMGVAFGTVVQSVGVAMLPLGAFGNKAKAAAEETHNMGMAISDAAGAIPAWQAGLIGVAAAGLAFLIYKVITGKTAIEEFTAAMQKSIAAANPLRMPGIIMGQLAVNAGKLAQAQKTAAVSAAGLTQHLAYGKDMMSSYAISTQDAAQRAVDLQSRQSLLTSDLQNLNHWTENTAKSVGTSFVGALVLAKQAGVNFQGVLSGNAKDMLIASMQVSDLVQGYKAMGQTTGMVGMDMQALAIQSGLQATKVSQLNQAWDQYMQTLTGGSNALSSFIQGVSQMNSGLQASSASLAGHFGSIRTDAAAAAFSLKNFSTSTAQSWQQFNAVVGQTAPQLIDWLRTAGAEGLTTGNDIKRAVADMIAKLIPLAGNSKTAQAELMGLWHQAGMSATSFKDLTRQVDATHPSMKNLSSIVQGITVNMANMGKVAQNLGVVIQQDITNTMAAAAVQASGLNGLMLQYDKSLLNNATSSVTLGERTKILTILENDFHMSKQQATAAMDVNTNSLVKNGSAAQTAAAKIQFHNQIVKDSGAIINGTASARMRLINDLVNMGTKADISRGKIATMISEITHIPKSEILRLIMDGTASGHVTVATQFTGALSRAGQLAGGALSGILNKHPNALGGHIVGPGSGTSDSIPAFLSNGEYVVKAAAVNKYGTQLLDQINAKKFQDGGPVIQGISPEGLGIWAENAHTNFRNTMYGDLRGSLSSTMNMGMSDALRAAEQYAQSTMSAAAQALERQVASLLTPTGSGGSIEKLMQNMAASVGWTGFQWSAMRQVEMMEAGFNMFARNPGSGAYGLAQFINGPGEYYQYGGNPNTAAGQITGMINYIRQRYGSPYYALQHELAYHWYDKGGMLPTGASLALNTTGKPEHVGLPEVMENHIHVHLDGKEIFTSLQRQTLRYNTRNSGARTGALAPGFGPQV